MNDLEKKFYETADQEIASKTMVRSLAAKALCDAGGDEKKTLALYIKLRVEDLQEEFVLQQERLRQEEHKEAEEQDPSASAPPPLLADEQSRTPNDVLREQQTKGGAAIKFLRITGMIIFYAIVAVFLFLATCGDWFYKDIELRPKEMGWVSRTWDDLANAACAKYYTFTDNKWRLEQLVFQVQSENCILRASSGQFKR